MNEVHEEDLDEKDVDDSKNDDSEDHDQDAYREYFIEAQFATSVDLRILSITIKYSITINYSL